jgi:hypothetical protein
MVSSVHPMVSIFFLFFGDFDPWKIDYLLNLACGIFASLGSRIVYKDMLNNMVSSIDHVVMNHQNHTRTNGIWGHVRYWNMTNLYWFGPLESKTLRLVVGVDCLRIAWTYKGRLARLILDSERGRFPDFWSVTTWRPKSRIQHLLYPSICLVGIHRCLVLYVKSWGRSG